MSDIRKDYSIDEFDNNVYTCLRSVKKEDLEIVVQGGYGKNNLGDDSLLLIIYEKIKKWFPKANVIAMCHYPERVVQQYDIPAIGFKSLKMVKTLLGCDVLIIGGGGIVNIVNTYSGLQTLRMFDMKGKFLFLSSLFMKHKKRKVIFYGVGMTSIPDKIVEFLMKITLPRADLVGVRDRVSLDNVRSFIKNKEKLFITYDPALDFNQNEKSKLIQKKRNYSSLKNKNIVISVRAIPNNEQTEALIQSLVKLINVILEIHETVHITLLPVSCHPSKDVENDIHICRTIYSNILEKRNQLFLVDSYLHPKRIQQILGESDLIIMSRLHGLILSYDFGIPTVVLSYNEKVALFAEMAGYKYIFNYEKLKGNELIDTVERILEE